MLLHARPYRFVEDFVCVVATDLSIFVAIVTTLVLRQDEDHVNDVVGSVTTNNEFVKVFLLAALCVLVPLPLTIAAGIKLLRVRMRARVDVGHVLRPCLVEMPGRSVLAQPTRSTLGSRACTCIVSVWNGDEGRNRVVAAAHPR